MGMTGVYTFSISGRRKVPNQNNIWRGSNLLSKQEKKLCAC